MTEKNTRIAYLDYLRVFATIGIIILHTSVFNIPSVEPGGFEWDVFNIYDSLVRWGVPVFVMMSGALFLGRENDLKKLYTKNILRLLAAFIFWSILYAFLYPLIGAAQGKGFSISLTNTVVSLLTGHYHMWFLAMMIGLYMVIPFLQIIVKDGRFVKYFLALSFAFAFMARQINTWANDFVGGNIASVSNCIYNGFLKNMNLDLVLGYTGYFILGYCLSRLDLEKSKRYIIYLLGIAGFVLTAFSNKAITSISGVSSVHYCDDLYLGVLLESIAIFVLFKNIFAKKEKVSPLLLKLSKYSFGAYLLHAGVMEVFSEFGFSTMSMNPIASVLVVAGATAVISFAISAVLNHVPLVKKYLV